MELHQALDHLNGTLGVVARISLSGTANTANPAPVRALRAQDGSTLLPDELRECVHQREGGGIQDRRVEWLGSGSGRSP